MKNYPQQPDRIEEDRQALAPYNFVPLPERIIRLTPDNLPDQDQYHANRLSGYIDCELTTESPLYTRAALTPENYAAGAQAKDESTFFYVTDKEQPVIPGSSLRGLLRGLVEIVSYSKVGPVSKSKLVYRAVGGTSSHAIGYRDRLMHYDGRNTDNKMKFTPLMQGGYMVNDNGEWKIRPAKKIGGTTFAYLEIDDDFFDALTPVAGCQNAYEVYIKTDVYEYRQVKHILVRYAPVVEKAASFLTGLRRGTLARSGPMNKKKYEAVIYEPDNSEKPLTLSDELIDDYLNQITPDQKKILQFEDEKANIGVLREGQPVFYLLDDDGSVFFFGHSRMLRFTYPNSPLDYVPEGLRREQDLDFAEALFGFTKQSKDGKSQSYAGRVFVSDAKLKSEQSDIWLAGNTNRVIIPKILASPKPTTFQHYLVQKTPNKEKIGFTQDGRPRYAVNLNDYTAPTPSETVIRGHKFYWHKGNAPLQQIEEPEKLGARDTQHTRIQPVKPGVQFQFHIDFENLLPEELGALLWVLKIANDDAYRLKIGMGKPLGMGAIKIAYELYAIDRNTRYAKLFGKQGWRTGWKKAIQTKNEAVASFEQFVLDSLKESSIKDLAEVDRIKALLYLLSWPGPDPEDTRYMEIERPADQARRGVRNPRNRPKVNEYDDRPVLPKSTKV